MMLSADELNRRLERMVISLTRPPEPAGLSAEERFLRLRRYAEAALRHAFPEMFEPLTDRMRIINGRVCRLVTELHYRPSDFLDTDGVQMTGWREAEPVWAFVLPDA